MIQGVVFSKFTKKMLVKVMAAACIAVSVAFGQTSGTWGMHSWRLTGTAPNQTLTISGTGDMLAFSLPVAAPWYSARDDIAKVVVEESVTAIGKYAFYEFSKLTSVAIPSSVTSIGDAAFCDCIGLTSIAIPGSVTSIGNDAFENCRGLTSVTIPSSVTSIGYFAFNRCTGLKQIINRRETPQTIDPNVFQGVTAANVKLFVPTSAVNAYRDATVWNSFENVSSLSVAKPTFISASEPPAYTGEEQSGGVIAEGLQYEISGIKGTNAGNYTARVVLISGCEWLDGTTDDLTFEWSIAKATGVFGTPAAVNTTYTPTLKLGDLTLPAGYAFNTPATALSVGNNQSFAATYTDPSGNFNAASGEIAVNVAANNQNPIRDIQKSDGRTGIRLTSGNIVYQKAEFAVILPDNDKVLEVKAVIYDNVGNVVFEKTERGASVSWDLTNAAGRNVANGSYLIVAEARGAKGTYAYSAKVGVKR